MGRFRFRLEQVLRLRRHVEEAAATRLAVARSEAEAARVTVASLEAARAEGRDRIARAQEAGAQVGTLLQLDLLLERVGALAREANTASRAADDRVEQVLGELRRALSARRTLERLRARARDAWRSEQARAEQKVLDEVAAALRRGGGLEGGVTDGRS